MSLPLNKIGKSVFYTGNGNFSILRRYSFAYYRQICTTGERNMPKKQQKSQAGKTSTDADVNPGPVISNPDKSITIKIVAKPGAKQNGITDITDEGVGLQIAAPPVDGQANTELVKYISKLLGLRKSDVTLETGAKSRAKTIVVYGMDKDAILEKLRFEKDS